MIEIINALVDNMIAKQVVSKIDGRRNWIIRAQLDGNYNPIMFCGGNGELTRRGLMSEQLDYMAKYHVVWFEFTYKKDYIDAIITLQNAGYKKI